MPTILSKRNLTPLGWAGVADLAVGLVLGVIGFFNVRFAAFFPLISLWYNCTLFLLCLCVLRVAGVRFDFFHRAVLLVFWAGAIVYTAWALGRRTFVYVWDYANYITRQYAAEAAFAEGSLAGFWHIFSSFSEDYTSFLTLFNEFPFCLTDRSGDGYAFAQVFCVVPSLLVLLAGLVLKIGQIFEVKHRFYYFLIGLSWCFTYPFLRMSALLGQPDWLGLIFAFAILILTLDYRFDTWQPLRLVLIFLATAAIILTRRWYLYFVVGYYLAYAVLVLAGGAKLARAGDKAQAKRRTLYLLAFGAGSVAVMLLLFRPMVANILAFDYADRYSYYNVGGMVTELYYHVLRLGLLNLILIALGLVFAWKRGHIALPCLAGCQLLVSMVLFTRVQNTGSHQMLLFVPGYLVLFLFGALSLAESISRRKALKLGYWGFTVAFAVSVRCSPLTTLALPGFLIDHFPTEATAFFVKMDKLTYDRKDIGQIRALADWLDENLAEDETAYLIPNDMFYNPDHFRNCELPARKLEGRLVESFSVPGTHNFPTQFFEATYVVTADPFPLTYVFDGELSHRFNEVFLSLRSETFTQVASFDMGNGTTFTIWERTAAPTRTEVETYLAAFAAEDAQYPEMFSQVAEKWLADRGL